jgi:phosphoglycolate phosphatase-like HAD superfamily hydrolase
MRDPDLVIFDVDGTLHDTFRWWPRVLAAGLERFAAATGLALPAPDPGEACAVVGLRDEAVWGPWLPAAERHRWRELRSVVVPLEVAELESGVDYLFPGVRALLAHLRALGVRTALASNCRSAYMVAWSRGQGLGALTDWQYCLDSPGVADKTDMVRAAIARAGARRAVMVGDREPDLAAARSARIPFVWRETPVCALTGWDARWRGAPEELLSFLGLPAISSAVRE